MYKTQIALLSIFHKLQLFFNSKKAFSAQTVDSKIVCESEKIKQIHLKAAITKGDVLCAKKIHEIK